MNHQKIDAIALFKNELNDEQQSVKVNAIRRLSIVLHSPGFNSSGKADILAYLSDFAKSSDNDEVLYGLSVSLGNCQDIFKTDMIPILETLMSADETVVREKAVDALIQLAKGSSKNDLKSKIIPFSVKMSQSDKFAQKLSALNAMCELYPLVDEDNQKHLLDRINSMFTEESLILRRKLASRIGTLVRYIPKDLLIQDFLNRFKSLALDDNDSVRILCIESLISLCEVFNDEENKQNVIPIIIQLTGDKSWRVKNHLAKNFAGLAQSLGAEISMTSLVSIFSTLLKDVEGEVRISAVNSLKNFVTILSHEKISSILAYLQSLSRDTVPLVRCGVCEVLLAMFTMNLEKLGKDIIKTRIQPIITDLVNDDDIEVKIEGLKLLKPWTRYINTSVIDLITNKTLKIDLSSKSWRVRHAELECLLDLAKIFKNGKLFDKFFKKLFFMGLKDSAYKVRQLSVIFIKDMNTFLDEDYIKINLLEDVLEIANNSKLYYTYQISALYALENFYLILKSPETRREKILSTILNMSESKVENIRLVALKVLISIYNSKTDQEGKAKIAGYIKDTMATDSSREVSLIADRFIKAM